jgi:hypothetical protein
VTLPAAAALAWKERHWIRVALVPLLLTAAVMGVFIISLFGAFMMPQPPSGFAPSGSAVADIPALYLSEYRDAGDRYGIDWAILAAIGKIETDHGRSTAPGVHSGVNSYGCCAGPMQFSVVGADGGTWGTYGHGGDVYDPRDAIPAAARYLIASGAPADYHAAILAYNHAEWYVADVLAQAVLYRGALSGGGSPQADSGDLREILANRRITLTAGQRADLQSGGIDPRLLGTMAWIGRRHSYIVTALRQDHSVNTTSGSRSNHADGRAVDIGSVDGQICRENWLAPSRTSNCSLLALELAHVTGQLRSTELIWCFDPDGPGDPRGFARADHCDHVHVGFDA